MSQMTIIALVLIGHFGLGIAGTLATYRAIEKSWLTGLGFGVVLAVVAVILEWQAGARLLVVTVDQMKVLTVAAVSGSLVGVLSTVTLTRPDLEPRTQTVREPPIDQEP